MNPRRRHQGGEAVDQLQRGQAQWAAAAGAGLAGGVDPVLGIALLQPVQGERRAGASALPVPIAAAAGAGRRDRSDAPRSRPCAGCCCTTGTHRAPCGRRRSGSRVRTSHKERGRSHERGCRIPDNDGTRARRGLAPDRYRRRCRASAPAWSRSGVGRCDRAACARAAGGVKASGRSRWPAAPPSCRPPAPGAPGWAVRVARGVDPPRSARRGRPFWIYSNSRLIRGSTIGPTSTTSNSAAKCRAVRPRCHQSAVGRDGRRGVQPLETPPGAAARADAGRAAAHRRDARPVALDCWLSHEERSGQIRSHRGLLSSELQPARNDLSIRSRDRWRNGREPVVARIRISRRDDAPSCPCLVRNAYAARQHSMSVEAGIELAAGVICPNHRWIRRNWRQIVALDQVGV